MPVFRFLCLISYSNISYLLHLHHGRRLNLLYLNKYFVKVNKVYNSNANMCSVSILHRVCVSFVGFALTIVLVCYTQIFV